MQTQLDNHDQWMVTVFQFIQQQGKLLTELHAQKEAPLPTKLDHVPGHAARPMGVTTMYTGNGSGMQEHLSLTAIDFLLKREAELLLDPQRWINLATLPPGQVNQGITKEQSSLSTAGTSNGVAGLNGLAVQQEPSLPAVTGLLETLQQLQQQLTAFRHTH